MLRRRQPGDAQRRCHRLGRQHPHAGPTASWTVIAVGRQVTGKSTRRAPGHQVRPALQHLSAGNRWDYRDPVAIGQLATQCLLGRYVPTIDHDAHQQALVEEQTLRESGHSSRDFARRVPTLAASHATSRGRSGLVKAEGSATCTFATSTPRPDHRRPRRLPGLLPEISSRSQRPLSLSPSPLRASLDRPRGGRGRQPPCIMPHSRRSLRASRARSGSGSRGRA